MRRALKLVAMAVVVLLGSGSALAELQCDSDMQSTLACMIPCCPSQSVTGVHAHSHTIPIGRITSFASMGCSESDCVADSSQVQEISKQPSPRQLQQILSVISSVSTPFAASPEMQRFAFDQRTRAHATELLVTLQVFRI
jgi:hypothetical protein